MKNRKKYLILLGISTLLLFLIAPLGGYPFGHHIKFSVALGSYFLLTYVYTRKIIDFKEQLILAGIIFIPIFLVCGILFIYLLGFHICQVPVPSNIAHFLGIVFALVVVNIKKPLKILVIAAMILGSLWVTFFGYAFWLNKVNFGTYSGLVHEYLQKTFAFYKNDGTSVTSSELKNKIVVLDFWSTSCGICFREFPILEAKYQQYRNDSSIELFAVNIPTKKDSTQTPFKVIRDNGYEFPVLVDRNSFAITNLKVQEVPQVFVISNDTVLFRGDISFVDDCIKKIKGSPK